RRGHGRRQSTSVALALRTDDAPSAQRARHCCGNAQPSSEWALTFGQNATLRPMSETPCAHASQPAGAVTFLFTDIEGSTALVRARIARQRSREAALDSRGRAAAGDPRVGLCGWPHD